MSKYIADKSYSKRPKNGLFIRGGNPEIEIGKSYTFDIKPRFDVEKEVKLIIFLIPDLQEAVNKGLLSSQEASDISYSRLIPDPDNQDQFKTPPLPGNAKAYSELINLPTINPKNGSNLEMEENFISFNSSSLKELQIIWPGETNYKTSSGNKINTIDEYIDEIVITAQNIYKFNIYQIKRDLNLVNLADNKVEFTQEFLSEETTNTDESSETLVVEEVIILNDITFKIDTEGKITNDKLGNLKIIEKIVEPIGFDFGDEEQDLSLLDDEFIESDFEGEEEEVLDPPFSQMNKSEEPAPLVVEDGVEYFIYKDKKYPQPPPPIEWKTLIQGWDTPDEFNGKRIPKVKISDKFSFNKHIESDILPIINSNEYKRKYNKGHRMLALVYAVKEGYKPGSKSYITKNPGNIGNTDSGASNPQKNLSDGMKLLMEYFEKKSKGNEKGWEFGQKRIQPFFSPEIELNKKNYDRPDGYVPGYEGNYQGEIGFFAKRYAVAARVSNNGIAGIATLFKINGYTIDINGNTKLRDLMNFNSGSDIKFS